MATRPAIIAGPAVDVLDGYRPGTVPVFEGKYLSVTTYRRDGTPVATPVWFVQENGRLLVETDADSGKIKRIRRDPDVLVAPCSARGRLKEAPTPARAEVLSGASRRHLDRLLASKYRADLLFIKPIRALQKAFGRGKTAAHPVVLAITPSRTRRDG